MHWYLVTLICICSVLLLPFFLIACSNITELLLDMCLPQSKRNASSWRVAVAVFLLPMILALALVDAVYMLGMFLLSITLWRTPKHE